MKRLVLVPALALALLVPAALAVAGLPKAKDPTIVVPTSLAGVALGMAEGKAKAAWGAGSKCDSAGGSNTRCYYGVGQTPQGYAYLELRDHKVCAAVVYGGHDANTGLLMPKAAKSIMEMQTSKGLGIGAKFAAVKAAYPKGEMVGSTTDPTFSWAIKGKGESSFYFSFDSAEKRVTTMIVNDGLPA